MVGNGILTPASLAFADNFFSSNKEASLYKVANRM